MRLPGIEPGSSAWEAPMITITLQALRVYSRWGSNPRPPAHKTGALPLSYWSVINKLGVRQRGTRPKGVRGRGFAGAKMQNGSIPDGTRTHNLRLRKPTPYPFGHWDFGTSSGTRTHNLTLRRGAPYPLGHGGLELQRYPWRDLNPQSSDS